MKEHSRMLKNSHTKKISKVNLVITEEESAKSSTTIMTIWRRADAAAHTAIHKGGVTREFHLVISSNLLLQCFF
ncbi:hypothetical protein Q3G72_007816 [Acer saccharum]|nr:hypothetical protein Q3G72_007816 [Acer saccharum]